MFDEIVVVGSGKKVNGWLGYVLSECPYHLSFQHIPCKQIPPKTGSALSAIAFQSESKAIILMEDLSDLVGWTRVIVQDEKGPVLWAVSRLNEDVLGVLDEAGVRGILTPDIDSLAVVCSIKMAIASWQKEVLYRRDFDGSVRFVGIRCLCPNSSGSDAQP